MSEKQTSIRDWIHTGIYAVLGFLLIFGFNKLDDALTDINILQADHVLHEYKMDLQLEASRGHEKELARLRQLLYEMNQ